MSLSVVGNKAKPGLAFRLTLNLGLVTLGISALFATIYFVLTVSLFSRFATEQLHQKAQSAALIVKAVSDSKESINSLTFIRKLRKAGLEGAIAVFNAKGRLEAHSDEKVSLAIGQFEANPKAKNIPVETQTQLLKNVAAFAKNKNSGDLYATNGLYYSLIKTQTTQVLIALEPQSPKLLVLAASFALLCLLGVALNTLFIYHFGHSLARVLSDIVRGIEVGSLRSDTFQASYNEVDELITSVSLRVNSAATTVPPTQDAPQLDVQQQMQNRLYEKPFPRIEQHELVVYPRRPKVQTHEFISAAHEAGRIDIFVGVTDSDSIDALLAKHRLQERFLTLTKENRSAKTVARELWDGFFAHSEVVPGMLYVRLTDIQNNLEISRAGTIRVFIAQSSGACREVQKGRLVFGSEFAAIEEEPLSATDQLIIVSHDAFAAMEVSAEDFAEILGRIASTKRGKHLLSGILEKIHQKLPAGETVPGLIAVLCGK